PSFRAISRQSPCADAGLEQSLLVVEAFETIPIALPGGKREPIALGEPKLPADVAFRKPRRAGNSDGGNARPRWPWPLALPSCADRRFVPEFVRSALIVEHEQAPRQAVATERARGPR